MGLVPANTKMSQRHHQDVLILVPFRIKGKDHLETMYRLVTTLILNYIHITTVSLDKQNTKYAKYAQLNKLNALKHGKTQNL